MNEANFVKRMNWIVTGDSFMKEMLLSVAHLMDDTGPDIIDAGSSPTKTLVGVNFASGEVALVNFALPMDYDQDGDRMILKLLVQPDGNASDFGILTTKVRHRPGVAVDATAGTAKAESSTTTASLAREVFLSMSGDSHQPGDAIQRSIDFNGTSADIVSLSIIYGSCFAAYNTDDRHRDAAATTGD